MACLLAFSVTQFRWQRRRVDEPPQLTSGTRGASFQRVENGIFTIASYADETSEPRESADVANEHVILSGMTQMAKYQKPLHSMDCECMRHWKSLGFDVNCCP